MQDKDFQLEQDWLDFVYENIDEQLAREEEQTKSDRDNLQGMRTSLWEEHGISGASTNQMMDVAQQITELRHRATGFGVQHRLLQQLQMAEKAPYFGRMDFHEEGMPGTEAMYIGIRSLMDQETNLALVYDWRAPVSSMFYDYGLGEASYEGPGGMYRGQISLKRQYRIRQRRIVYMFDSELKIDDEFLQEVLGQHASEKMRTIVHTIQREQNQAIRNDKDALLLVEGPAGSGKTSVALHRVAYLLYRYRDSIHSQNIVIFSPNHIFCDYISHVLPELGEENVVQTTFQDFVEPFLGWEWEAETQAWYLESLAQQDPSARQERIKTMAFKSSPEFKGVLDRFIDGIIKDACSFADVRVGPQLVISGREQQRLYRENYSYLPPQKRLDKIYRRIMFLLRPARKAHLKGVVQKVAALPIFDSEPWWTVAREAVKQVNEELGPMLQNLRQRLVIDAIGWYRRLWQEPELWERVAGGIKPPTSAVNGSLLEQNQIAFEDVVPLTYLLGELGGYPVRRWIQHVVVDEVQDYAPMQLDILRKAFPRAQFTFVGDAYQSLHPYLWQRDDTLEGVFAGLEPKTVKLTKSYRSTEEIFRFCDGLLGKRIPAETVLRHGQQPTVRRVKAEEQTRHLHRLIRDQVDLNYETIAVICQTAEECARMYQGLRRLDPSLDLALLAKERSKFAAGVVIVSVFLAKGLEFDAVIIPEASESCYGEEYQRRILYVACSRALHSLSLLFTGHLAPFIEAMPKELYILE